MSEFQKVSLYKEKALEALREDEKQIAKKYLQKAIKYLKILEIKAEPSLKKTYQAVIKNYLTIIEKIDGEKASSKKIQQKIALQEPAQSSVKDIPKECQASIITTSTTYKDLAGLDDLRNELKKTIMWPLKHPEKVKKWKWKGVKGILMHGPPGCGKTYLIKCTGGEFQLPIINLNPSQVYSKYVGDSPKAVRKAYGCAEKIAPSIVFVDEIDKLITKNDSSGVVVQVQSEFQQILSGLKESRTITIAATNAPWDLDPALIRRGRLGHIVYVPPPDQQTRKDLFKIHLSGVPLDKSINFKELAELTKPNEESGWRYSCSDIAEMCLSACEEGLRLEIEQETDQEIKINQELIIDVINNTNYSISPKMITQYKNWENRAKEKL
ncbi:MAG: AAA family ATPase [Candidatus Lokiarchaeota archaeon]|nr:AAA family ATPase [Candidatus Lokiarchaeota archaeon]